MGQYSSCRKLPGWGYAHPCPSAALGVFISQALIGWLGVEGSWPGCTVPAQSCLLPLSRDGNFTGTRLSPCLDLRHERKMSSWLVLGPSLRCFREARPSIESLRHDWNHRTRVFRSGLKEKEGSRRCQSGVSTQGRTTGQTGEGWGIRSGLQGWGRGRQRRNSPDG